MLYSNKKRPFPPAHAKRNGGKNAITLNVKGNSTTIQRQKALLEEGEYTARITDVDLKEDKANESQYLHVAYEVERGEGQLPFELRERIYFSNDNHQRLDEFLSEALQQDPAGSIEGEDLIGKTGAIEIETKHNKAGNLYNYVNAWDFSSVGKESEVDFDA